jgi:hypothetical protein
MRICLFERFSYLNSGVHKNSIDVSASRNVNKRNLICRQDYRRSIYIAPLSSLVYSLAKKRKTFSLPAPTLADALRSKSGRPAELLAAVLFLLQRADSQLNTIGQLSKKPKACWVRVVVLLYANKVQSL